jgi:hypothetical protein
MTETVTAIERVLTRGSSFPSIVVGSSGRRWVMKLSGTGPGRRALATEYVALALSRRLGLNVPDAVPLRLPGDLPWQTGTDEFYEAVQRSAGWNLGVGFVADARDVVAADLATLPEPFLQRLAAVDALMQNMDRAAANPNIIADAAGTPWAIDFGASLLINRLERGALQPRQDLPANHFLAQSPAMAGPALVREMAAALDATFLNVVVDALPDAWLQEPPFAREVLLSRLQKYAESVRTS